jgi:hypothetical protein
VDESALQEGVVHSLNGDPAPNQSGSLFKCLAAGNLENAREPQSQQVLVGAASITVEADTVRSPNNVMRSNVVVD